MANPEHLAILKQGVKVWNEWYDQLLNDIGERLPSGDEELYARILKEMEPDLSGADLGETNLSHVNFEGVNLEGVNLNKAKLVQANLNAANLRNANLGGTNLSIKVVGDFSGWDKDAAKYEKAFDKLLKGLQAERGKMI